MRSKEKTKLQKRRGERGRGHDPLTQETSDMMTEEEEETHALQKVVAGGATATGAIRLHLTTTIATRKNLHAVVTEAGEVEVVVKIEMTDVGGHGAPNASHGEDQMRTRVHNLYLARFTEGQSRKPWTLDSLSRLKPSLREAGGARD